MIRLKELLRKSLQSSGVFQPFNYAIGVEYDLENYLKGQTFPLPEPYTNDALDDIDTVWLVPVEWVFYPGYFVAIIKALLDVEYSGMVRPDHIPRWLTVVRPVP